MKSGGIYRIVNLVNGKVYIGSALRFRTRFNEHRWRLRRGRHHSPRLQRAWDKYGEDAFRFEVVEVVGTPDDLIPREQHWIDATNCVSVGYNCSPTAGSTRGTKASEVTRQKMRAARQHVSAETRAKRSAAMKGRKQDPAHRRKIAEAQRGRKASPEARARMSAAALARTPDVAAKIAASRPRLVHTEESRAHLSRALTGIKRSAETRAKIGAASKGRTHSDETKAKRLASWKVSMAAKKAAV
jgi:group I intron endonuclease